jgi:cell division septation protein DedD
MSKLDRSRPFGEVFGDHPARFEQDGKFFNAAEAEIELETVVETDDLGNKIRVTRVKATSPSAEKPTKPAGKAKPKAKPKAKEPEAAPVAAPAADEVEDQLAAQLGETDGSFE